MSPRKVIDAILASAFLSCLGSASSSLAALAVQSGQIDENQYSFVLPGDQLYFTEESQMGGALQSFANMQWIHEDWIYEGNPAMTQYLRASNGFNTAEVVMAWDFSQSGYRPGSVDFYNRIFILSGDATATLSWSITGLAEDYLAFAFFDSPGIYDQLFNTIELPEDSVTVFMRVLFEDPSGNFDFNQNFWARSFAGYPPDSNPGFGAVFSVIPVPEASAQKLVCFALMVVGLLRWKCLRESPAV